MGTNVMYTSEANETATSHLAKLHKEAHFMFYDNLLKLCKERGLKITNVVNALGFSQGNMAQWKKGTCPKSTTVQKFADFFKVSTDVLLRGGETGSPMQDPFADLSVEKRDMISLIISLPDNKVKAIHHLAQTALIEEIMEKVQTLNQEDFSLIVSTVAQLCNQPHC